LRAAGGRPARLAPPPAVAGLRARLPPVGPDRAHDTHLDARSAPRRLRAHRAIQRGRRAPRGGEARLSQCADPGADGLRHRPRRALRGRGRHRDGVHAARGRAGLLALIVMGPYLYTVSPTLVAGGERLKPPSMAHPLGTDQFGREVLARVIAGGQQSLRVATLTMALTMVAGSLLGLVAGSV